MVLYSDICILSSPNFKDEERLRVLVMMSAQELANGISYSGHMYAMTRAARSLTPTADLQETFGGMDQASLTHDVLLSLTAHMRTTVEYTNA